MKRMRPLLGTFVEIAAVSAKGPAPAQRLQTAMTAAFSAIEQVHRLMGGALIILFSGHVRAGYRLRSAAKRSRLIHHRQTGALAENELAQ